MKYGPDVACELYLGGFRGFTISHRNVAIEMGLLNSRCQKLYQRNIAEALVIVNPAGNSVIF